MRGDRWTEVDDARSAVATLGTESRRVLLAIGRRDLASFETAPQHWYLIRSVDPVTPLPALPEARYVLERGPFDVAAERELLQQHAIDVIVAKNSGGEASYGKIAAARALGLPVILLRRPPPAPVTMVHAVAAAVGWLDHVLSAPRERGV
jgi:precorrin-6A/cobalt-precorrin-6A reductase